MLIFLPLGTQRILLGIIAVGDHFLLQVGELPPGVGFIPGEFSKLPTNQIIDASEALVQNHRVLLGKY